MCVEKKKKAEVEGRCCCREVRTSLLKRGGLSGADVQQCRSVILEARANVDTRYKKNTWTSRRGGCSLALLTHQAMWRVQTVLVISLEVAVVWISTTGLFQVWLERPKIAYFRRWRHWRRGRHKQTHVCGGNLSAIWLCDPRPASTSHLWLPSVRQSDDDSNCSAHANGSPSSAGEEKVGHQIGLTVIHFTKQGMNR